MLGEVVREERAGESGKHELSSVDGEEEDELQLMRNQKRGRGAQRFLPLAIKKGASVVRRAAIEESGLDQSTTICPGQFCKS